MAEQAVSRQIYYRVFAALMALTLLTWGIAYIDLGARLNLIVALTIAICKALLVVLFFMHVRYSSRLTQVFAGAGVLWLIVLLVITLSDYLTRGDLSY
jgi:cytochrome c oxidase subunit 4